MLNLKECRHYARPNEEKSKTFFVKGNVVKCALNRGDLKTAVRVFHRTMRKEGIYVPIFLVWDIFKGMLD